MDSIVTTEDTIAAIASAISIGKGGVAIIRVSGKDAINSCKKIVQTKSKYAWESHRVFRGFIQENKQNKFIDEVLILVMKSQIASQERMLLNSLPWRNYHSK